MFFLSGQTDYSAGLNRVLMTPSELTALFVFQTVDALDWTPKCSCYSRL